MHSGRTDGTHPESKQQCSENIAVAKAQSGAAGGVGSRARPIQREQDCPPEKPRKRKSDGEAGFVHALAFQRIRYNAATGPPSRCSAATESLALHCKRSPEASY